MSSGLQSKFHASLGYTGLHPVSNKPFPTHSLKLGSMPCTGVRLRLPTDFVSVYF